jgi:hypothetical protein
MEYASGSRPALAQSEYYDSDVYGHERQDAVIDGQWHVREAARKAAE